MIPGDLRRAIVAPEIVVVDLVDHALAALRLSLLAAHPLLVDSLAALDDAPVQRRTRALLAQVARLRRALDAYRRIVDDRLREPPRDDFAF